MEQLKNIFSNIMDALAYEFINTNDVHISLYNILTLLLLIFLSRLAVYVIKKGLNRYQKSSSIDGFDEAREYTVGQLAKYLIYTFAIILSIESLGLDISILIASSLYGRNLLELNSLLLVSYYLHTTVRIFPFFH